VDMGKLSERLAGGIVIFDGAMGTEIYRRNFFVNASYEQLCLSSPDTIRGIHQSYLDAGAEVLTTNSFNANARRLGRFGLAADTVRINRAAAQLAREVAGDRALVAGSIGPVGDPESAEDRRNRRELLEEQISGLLETDFLIFESLRTLADLDAVLAAVKKFPGIDYVVSFAIDPTAGANADPLLDFLAEVEHYDGEKPVAVGLNCGGGPESTLLELEKLAAKSQYPIIVQPNAGVPRGIDGRMLYMTSGEYFSTYAKRYAQLGAAGIGGCCGIGPEHIAELARTIKPLVLAEKRAIPQLEVKDETLPPPPPLAERSGFGAKLAAGKFVAGVELTPPRGFDLSGAVAAARLCKAAGIDVVNLPDGPRASARITPLAAAAVIERETGLETIPHCCCRDRSLIGLQAELLAYAGMGIHNLLFITGDPPKLGNYPFSSGVFDTDSIGLVKLQNRMNRGVDLGGDKLNAQTHVVIGVGADPSAIDPEREYRRICEKAEAGADFVITQPVFDVEALLKFIRRIEHLHLPLIAGIWPLTSLKNAQFMKTEVPGVSVPDRVVERMARSEDREIQRQTGIEIARESIAAIRSAVQGVQVSAPFGNVKHALKVLE